WRTRFLIGFRQWAPAVRGSSLRGRIRGHVRAARQKRGSLPRGSGLASGRADAMRNTTSGGESLSRRNALANGRRYGEAARLAADSAGTCDPRAKRGGFLSPLEWLRHRAPNGCRRTTEVTRSHPNGAVMRASVSTPYESRHCCTSRSAE